MRWTPALAPIRLPRRFWRPYRYFDVASLFIEVTLGVVIRERQSFDLAAGKTDVTNLAASAQLGVGWLQLVVMSQLMY
jgi:hypothetical protein